MADHLWERYLFERHSRAELSLWARSLRYFRFCRAIGGHANDGDQLVVAIRAESERDITETLGLLGIPLRMLPPDNPRPQPGVQYTGTEFAAFLPEIAAFPHIQQPSHVRLAGAKAHAWVQGGRLEITIADEISPYDVSAQAVESARHVEPLLEPLASRIIDPPLNSRHCICPRFYPEFWADAEPR